MSQEQRKSVWIVSLPDGKTFTMGGEPMTHKEALETVQCIWATTKPKDEIKVS
jgi:hypothetical protein